MTGPTPCDEVRAVAPEMALGVLSGGERATVLTHLAGCEHCRDLVAELARVADGLLLAAPVAEPPPGFESSVLDRLASERGHRPPALDARRRRRVALVAAVAAVALVAGGTVAGWALARPDPAEQRYFEALRAVGGDGLTGAPMEDPEGDRVGEVFLYDGQPSWVFLTMDGWSGEWGGVPYLVRVDLADGRQVVLDGVTLGGGDGAWGSALDLDVDQVRWVGVVDATGRVYCGARLPEA